jgi:hypothetical protein
VSRWLPNRLGTLLLPLVVLVLLAQQQCICASLLAFLWQKLSMLAFNQFV